MAMNAWQDEVLGLTDSLYRNTCFELCVCVKVAIVRPGNCQLSCGRRNNLRLLSFQWRWLWIGPKGDNLCVFEGEACLQPATLPPLRMLLYNWESEREKIALIFLTGFSDKHTFNQTVKFNIFYYFWSYLSCLRNGSCSGHSQTNFRQSRPNKIEVNCTSQAVISHQHWIDIVFGFLSLMQMSQWVWTSYYNSTVLHTCVVV